MKNILPSRKERPVLWITAIAGATFSVVGIDVWIAASLFQTPKSHFVFDISQYIFSGGVILLFFATLTLLICPPNKSMD